MKCAVLHIIVPGKSPERKIPQALNGIGDVDPLNQNEWYFMMPGFPVLDLL